SRAARERFSNGNHTMARSLLEVGLAYKETFESKAYEGLANKGETQLKAQKRLGGTYKITAGKDLLGVGRERLGVVIDALCPPEGVKVFMPRERLEAEIRTAMDALKRVKKAAVHAQQARAKQSGVVSLGDKQKTKPDTSQSDMDIAEMGAYALMGNEKEAGRVLDEKLDAHLNAEEDAYIAVLELPAKLELLAKNDAKVQERKEKVGNASGNLRSAREKIEESKTNERDIDDTAMAIGGGLYATAVELDETGKKLDAAHVEAQDTIRKGAEAASAEVSQVLKTQDAVIAEADQVISRAGGMQAIGTTALAALGAYHGLSGFTAGRTNLVGTTLTRLERAQGDLRDGDLDGAAQQYADAQDAYFQIQGFATGTAYGDQKIYGFTKTTADSFAVLVGKKEGDAAVAAMRLDGVYAVGNTEIRGEQALDAVLPNVYVAATSVETLESLGATGAAGYMSMKTKGLLGAYGEKSKERLREIGYVPYEERVAEMRRQVATLNNPKTNRTEMRYVHNSILNNANDGEYQHRTGANLQGALVDAVGMVAPPVFIAKTFATTVENAPQMTAGGWGRTAVLGVAIATGALGKMVKAGAEVAAAAEVAEATGRMTKLERFLDGAIKTAKDPLAAVHTASTLYLVGNGTVEGAESVYHYTKTGNGEYLGAAISSITNQLPIVTGFTMPLLSGRVRGATDHASNLGRYSEEREREAAKEVMRPEARAPEVPKEAAAPEVKAPTAEGAEVIVPRQRLERLRAAAEERKKKAAEAVKPAEEAPVISLTEARARAEEKKAAAPKLEEARPEVEENFTLVRDLELDTPEGLASFARKVEVGESEAARQFAELPKPVQDEISGIRANPVFKVSAKKGGEDFDRFVRFGRGQLTTAAGNIGSMIAPEAVEFRMAVGAPEVKAEEKATAKMPERPVVAPIERPVIAPRVERPEIGIPLRPEAEAKAPPEAKAPVSEERARYGANVAQAERFVAQRIKELTGREIPEIALEKIHDAVNGLASRELKVSEFWDRINSQVGEPTALRRFPSLRGIDGTEVPIFQNREYLEAMVDIAREVYRIIPPPESLAGIQGNPSIELAGITLDLIRQSDLNAASGFDARSGGQTRRLGDLNMREYITFLSDTPAAVNAELRARGIDAEVFSAAFGLSTDEGGILIIARIPEAREAAARIVAERVTEFNSSGRYLLDMVHENYPGQEPYFQETLAGRRLRAGVGHATIDLTTAKTSGPQETAKVLGKMYREADNQPELITSENAASFGPKPPRVSITTPIMRRGMDPVEMERWRTEAREGRPNQIRQDRVVTIFGERDRKGELRPSALTQEHDAVMLVSGEVRLGHEMGGNPEAIRVGEQLKEMSAREGKAHGQVSQGKISLSVANLMNHEAGDQLLYANYDAVFYARDKYAMLHGMDPNSIEIIQTGNGPEFVVWIKNAKDRGHTPVLTNEKGTGFLDLYQERMNGRGIGDRTRTLDGAFRGTAYGMTLEGNQINRNALEDGMNWLKYESEWHVVRTYWGAREVVPIEYAGEVATGVKTEYPYDTNYYTKRNYPDRKPAEPPMANKISWQQFARLADKAGSRVAKFLSSENPKEFDPELYKELALAVEVHMGQDRRPGSGAEELDAYIKRLKREGIKLRSYTDLVETVGGGYIGKALKDVAFLQWADRRYTDISPQHAADVVKVQDKRRATAAEARAEAVKAAEVAKPEATAPSEAVPKQKKRDVTGFVPRAGEKPKSRMPPEMEAAFKSEQESTAAQVEHARALGEAKSRVSEDEKAGLDFEAMGKYEKEKGIPKDRLVDAYGAGGTQGRLNVLKELGMDTGPLERQLGDQSTNTGISEIFDLVIKEDIASHPAFRGRKIDSVDYALGGGGGARIFTLEGGDRVLVKMEGAEASQFGTNLVQVEFSGKAAPRGNTPEIEVTSKVTPGKGHETGAVDPQGKPVMQETAVVEGVQSLAGRTMTLRIDGEPQEARVEAVALTKELFTVPSDPIALQAFVKDPVVQEAYRLLGTKEGTEELFSTWNQYVELSRRIGLIDRYPRNTAALLVETEAGRKIVFVPIDVDFVSGKVVWDPATGAPDFRLFNDDFVGANRSLLVNMASASAAAQNAEIAPGKPLLARPLSVENLEGSMFSGRAMQGAMIAPDNPALAASRRDQVNLHDGKPAGMGYDATDKKGNAPIGALSPLAGKPRVVTRLDGRMSLKADEMNSLHDVLNAPTTQQEFWDHQKATVTTKPKEAAGRAETPASAKVSEARELIRKALHESDPDKRFEIAQDGNRIYREAFADDPEMISGIPKPEDRTPESLADLAHQKHTESDRGFVESGMTDRDAYDLKVRELKAEADVLEEISMLMRREGKRGVEGTVAWRASRTPPAEAAAKEPSAKAAGAKPAKPVAVMDDLPLEMEASKPAQAVKPGGEKAPAQVEAVVPEVIAKPETIEGRLFS
ncbi:MAG: hypothetical protein PHF60_05125, partial [Candidatus ainarchaeum sp.]|nr:hypothetical protein [Candidatus ainarchaeum sp.]